MNDKHKYYATAIGVCAFFTFAIFAVKSCDSHLSEKEKTKQLEIINKNKKP